MLESAVCQLPFWNEVIDAHPLTALQQTPLPEILDRLSVHPGAANAEHPEND
ncbi:MAG: hypothetical protein AAFO87_09880 [Cyanobacteria bacterium J06607_6]